MTCHENLYGLILTGGKSTRMGSDKALLNYHGIPQREHLFNLLEKFCKKVFVSCRSDQPIPDRFNPLVDQFNFSGPMNGILTALQLHRRQAWLVVAVDMPFIDEHILNILITNRNDSVCATCFRNDMDKLPEPLLSLWMPSAYLPLLRFVKNGNGSPRHFLRTHSVHLLDTTEQQSFVNINYPHELNSWNHCPLSGQPAECNSDWR